MIEFRNNPNSFFQNINGFDEPEIQNVRAYFPELDDKIVTFVGMNTNAPYAGLTIWGKERNIIRFNLEYRITRYVIAHELTHLVQFHCRGTVPFGERSCDLYTLARDPWLNDSSPHYLCLPQEVRNGWNDDTARYCCDVARMAIKRRSEGTRQYIKWFEDTLKIGAYFRGHCEVVTTPGEAVAENISLSATAQKCNLSPESRTSGLQSEGV